MKFATERGNAGIGERYKEAVAGLESGASIGDGVIEYVADWALRRYDLRVRAVLRKAGLDVGDDGPLTVEVIKEKVRAAMASLELEELTPAGVMAAVDKKVAAQLSERLGFEVTTAFNPELAKEQVKAQVMAALANGTGAGILKGKTLHGLRKAATLARLGVSAEDYTTKMNRLYVRRYAKKHERTWV